MFAYPPSPSDLHRDAHTLTSSVAAEPRWAFTRFSPPIPEAPRVSEWASRRGASGVVLVLGIRRSNYNSLTKWDLEAVSDRRYELIVNGFRSGGRRSYTTGYDVVFGPVAQQNAAGWWEADRETFPSQYKFETRRATGKLSVIGILPVA